MNEPSYTSIDALLNLSLGELKRKDPLKQRMADSLLQQHDMKSSSTATRRMLRGASVKSKDDTMMVDTEECRVVHMEVSQTNEHDAPEKKHMKTYAPSRSVDAFPAPNPLSFLSSASKYPVEPRIIQVCHPKENCVDQYVHLFALSCDFLTTASLTRLFLVYSFCSCIQKYSFITLVTSLTVPIETSPASLLLPITKTLVVFTT
jgi:hypothetical protein